MSEQWSQERLAAMVDAYTHAVMTTHARECSARLLWRTPPEIDRPSAAQAYIARRYRSNPPLTYR